MAMNDDEDDMDTCIDCGAGYTDGGPDDDACGDCRARRESVEHLRDLLAELIEWDLSIAGPGGHEATVWKTARRTRNRLSKGLRDGLRTVGL